MFAVLLGAAYNLQGLQDTGITHIVSLENAAPCTKFDGFHCLHITGLWDNTRPENSISQYFNQTLPFIHNALHNNEDGDDDDGNGRVLVHCWSGVSRSVSTIVGYMIKYYHMSPDDALTTIRETRPQADPNSAYLQELDDFYLSTIRAQSSSSVMTSVHHKHKHSPPKQHYGG